MSVTEVRPVPPYVSAMAEPFHVPCVTVPSFEFPDTARLVVVAFVEVELMIERLVSVLLAELTKPAFNVCTAVHVFACPRLSDATTLPVVGETVSVPSELVTELTLPPPPAVIHTLLIATHPPVRFSPLFHVDVAPDALMMDPPESVMPLLEARPPVEIPPINVEVALDVAFTYANVGVVVPLK